VVAVVIDVQFTFLDGLEVLFCRLHTTPVHRACMQVAAGLRYMALCEPQGLHLQCNTGPLEVHTPNLPLSACIPLQRWTLAVCVHMCVFALTCAAFHTFSPPTADLQCNARGRLRWSDCRPTSTSEKPFILSSLHTPRTSCNSFCRSQPERLCANQDLPQ
jgi:hypothetical protein